MSAPLCSPRQGNSIREEGDRTQLSPQAKAQALAIARVLLDHSIAEHRGHEGKGEDETVNAG